MATVAWDTTENIQATRDWVSNLEGWMEDAEVVQIEVDEWFSEVENKINELKLNVMMLVVQWDMMGWDLQQIRNMVVNQQEMITGLHELVDLLREQVLALQHGVGNPIIIEDFSGTDSESSGEDVKMYYPAPQGLLIPVVDEDSTAVSSVW